MFVVHLSRDTYFFSMDGYPAVDYRLVKASLFFIAKKEYVKDLSVEFLPLWLPG